MPKPHPRLVHRLMHPLSEDRLDSFQKARQTLCDWLSTQAEMPLPGFTAVMRESQKVERLWAPLFALPRLS